jgi:Uma2 family endonuclease
MATGTLMTVEEFLALPDDGIERDLIRGEVREYPMTRRGKPHCVTMTNLATVLQNWKMRQDAPRGCVCTGDMRVLVHRDPDTFVGADIVYVSPQQAARVPDDARFLDEPPTLVIEILSPSDTVEDVVEKIRDYLGAGVPLVLKVDPFDKTVLAYRPGAPPQLFHSGQDLTCEPYLPGFRVPVDDLFAG